MKTENNHPKKSEPEKSPPSFYYQQKERIFHWFNEACDACDGKYGKLPQGEHLDYWRGRRAALGELAAFYALIKTEYAPTQPKT